MLQFETGSAYIKMANPRIARPEAKANEMIKKPPFTLLDDNVKASIKLPEVKRLLT